MKETVWDFALYGACKGGHIKLVDLLVNSCNIDLNVGLITACKNKKVEIVKYLIEHGANDWNKGLLNACSIKNDELMQLMIDQGATKCDWCKKSIEIHIEKMKNKQYSSSI